MKLNNKLVVAVSSRALFDLDESHKLFLKSKDEYVQAQIEHKDTVLEKGHSFELISKFLKLNQLKDTSGNVSESVEVILISQNSLVTGRRILNSINHYGLNITRSVFTCGDNPAEYVDNEDLNIHLFLSHDKDAVKWALNCGIPSAIMMSGSKHSYDDEIRIAFDGDAVLFSDESERIYQEQNLNSFQENEKNKINDPLPPGPFNKLFIALSELAKLYPEHIKIGLFTARGEPAAMRVLNTFDAWNIHPTHGSFLGGVTKRHFVRAFKADLFLDDHPKHCQDAFEYVGTGHVPSGITNSSGY